MQDKTKFAKSPKEGYLCLEQIWNIPENTKSWRKSKNLE